MASAATERVQRGGDAVRSGFDVMLADAATGTPRFFAPGPAVKVAAGLARHPRGVVRRAAGLTSELARAATGRSDLAPAAGDRRFADAAWRDNWLLRDLLASYLAVGETVDGLIGDAGVDWRTERQARLAAGNVMDALAPTNFPWSNPAVLREIVNTGGANLARGLRQLARDLSTPPRLPATVDTSRFEVGDQPRGHARVGGAAHRRARAAPLPAADQRGARDAPAADPADDQQVLRPGPRARPQPHRVPGGPRPAGVRDLLAQPRPGAGPLRSGHLRPGGGRGPRCRGRDLRGRDGPSGGGMLGWDHHLRSARAPRGLGRSGRCRQPHADGVRAGQCAGRDGLGAGHPGPRRGGGRRVSAQGVPRRPGAGGSVHLVASQRPGVVLRDQQLPARQGTAGVRRPVLEPGHGADGRRPAPGFCPHRHWTTRSPARARSMCSGRRSTCPTSTSTSTPSPASAITSCRGRTPTAAPSCSAPAGGSCSPAAATFRRWSTRRPRRHRDPSELPRHRRASLPTPMRSWLRPRSCRGSWWPDWDVWLAARSGAMRRAPSSLGNRRFRAQAKAPGTYVLAS